MKIERYEYPAIAVEKSQNSKLSKNRAFSATYVSQETCPSTCPFRGSGCYAENGPIGIQTRRLSNCTEKDIVTIAKAEAAKIRELSGKNPLRLHVVGDSRTEETASIVAEACKEYMEKHGQPVYTYTHARRVRRSAWGKVSVIRSCETVRQCQQAHMAGFAVSMVVPEFKSNMRYYLGRGMYGIPCPVQTGKAKSCHSCRLCFNDTKLHNKNNVVLFKVHGSGKNRAAQKLKGECP